jgi:hypothetical protein
MEMMMIRLLLFACLALAAILLFQSDLSATGYQAQIGTRLAQADSDNAQSASDPSTTSDTGNSDDSGKPTQDQE